MELTIKWKDASHMVKEADIIYYLLFPVLCDRPEDEDGIRPDGVIETFRDMAGVLMAIIIMSHYKWEDF